MIQSDFGLPDGTYDLKIGKSFSKNSKGRQEYHTLRYDFKPKSVSAEQEAYIAVGSNDDVHLAFANDADNLTMYKGSSKALKDGKECLLIFDEDRGEMRLEKVVSNLNVKQTRGTADETEHTIRGQIEKIRRHRKPAKRQLQSPTPEVKLSPIKSAPTKSIPEKLSPPVKNPIPHDSIKEQLFAEMSSSDESEEEGEIVDEENPQEKPQSSTKSPPVSSPKKYDFDLDSSSESSSSSSEDEFAAELEKRLNASSSPEPNNDDMPDLLNQKTSPPITQKPSFSAFKLQPLLANDLDLSDSSEDDD